MGGQLLNPICSGGVGFHGGMVCPTRCVTPQTVERSPNDTGLDVSLIHAIQEELGQATADCHTRPGLDPHPEAILLVATMTGIANGLLAGTFTPEDAHRTLKYAIDLSTPTDA